MHIAFCISDNYTPLIAITLQSFIDHHSDNDAFIFHVVSENLAQENQVYLRSILAQRPSWQLHFYQIDTTKLQETPLGPFTIHTWFRVLLEQLLPATVEVVLYLDADTLIAAPIYEIFNYDYKNYAVAGVKDQQNFIRATKRRLGLPQSHLYICAGVLLMNLHYWRTHHTAQQILDWAQTNASKLGCPDQDAINVVLKDAIKVLPAKWGVIVKNYLYDAFYQTEEAAEAYHHPCIFHYAGCAPWYKELSKIAPRFQAPWYATNARMPRPVAMRRYHTTLLKHIKAFGRNVLEGRLGYPRITNQLIEQKLKQFGWQ